jgi:hypothetical protein
MLQSRDVLIDKDEYKIKLISESKVEPSRLMLAECQSQYMKDVWFTKYKD